MSGTWIKGRYYCDGLCETCQYSTEDNLGYFCDDCKIDTNKVDYPVPNKCNQ